MRSNWTRSILAAAALAGLGSAQAATLDFNTPQDFPLFFSGDVYQTGGMNVTLWTADEHDGISDDDGFVGGLVDLSSCLDVRCPSNASSQFLSMLDDGVASLSLPGYASFGLSGFRASFLGAADESLAGVSGLLGVLAVRNDGSAVLASFPLLGPNSAGQLSFQSFLPSDAVIVGGTGTLAGSNFVEINFYGFSCNATGSCQAFSSNKGQFALDDVAYTAAAPVPEPSQWLLMGLGLAAVGAAARRRKAAV